MMHQLGDNSLEGILAGGFEAPESAVFVEAAANPQDAPATPMTMTSMLIIAGLVIAVISLLVNLDQKK